MLLSPVLFVKDTKIIQDILISEFSSFSDRGMQGNADVDPMAMNLLLQDGEQWRKNRQLLTPAFTSGKLKGMFDTIVACGSSLNKHLDRFAESNETIEIRDVLARFTTNVIGAVGFGIRIDCIENPDEEFRKYGQRFFELTTKNSMRIALAAVAPKVVKFLRMRFVDKDVGDFMIETVRQNLEYREKNNIIRKDFLQLMMQIRNTGNMKEDGDWSSKATSSEKKLSLKEISAHSFLFLTAGFETASTTMAFCIYELAKNPETQSKAQREIDEALKKHDGELTYESIGEMKYLENCIDETLRLHTPLGAVARVCTKDYKIPQSNTVIEANTHVIIPISALHNDPKYFEQPKRFMPERFDEANRRNKTFANFPHLPFGAGPKNCLGLRLGILQTKVALVLLLKKYQFELGKQHVNRELRLDPRGVIRSTVDGINVKVHFR